MTIVGITRAVAIICLLTLTCPGQSSPEEIFNQAKSQYHNSDWDGGMTNFTRTIEAGFDLYNSYSYRAYALAEKGESNRAAADCNQVIKLYPRSSGSYYWAAEIELMLNRVSEAEGHLATGTRLNPAKRPPDLVWSLSSKWVSRAFKLFRAGDLDAAITNLNKAISISSSNFSAYVIRGWLKVQQKHYDSAIADAYRAISLAGSYPEAYNVRGWARYGRGDISGAREDCKKCMDLSAKNVSFFTYENDVSGGLFAFINNDFGEATAKWNHCLAVNTNMPPPLQDFLQSWIDQATAKAAAGKPKQ